MAKAWAGRDFEALLRREEEAVARLLGEIEELAEFYRSRLGLDSYRRGRIYDQATDSLLRGSRPAIERCRAPSAMRPFVRTHVRRIAISQLRHARTEDVRILSNPAVLGRCSRRVPPPPGRRSRAQGSLYALLVFLATCLSDMEMDVATLHYGRGLAFSKVAALVHRPLNCVKQANARARAKVEHWARDNPGLEVELCGEIFQVADGVDIPHRPPRRLTPEPEAAS